MRSLFEIDTHDYNTNGKALVRPSVRAIIVRDGLVGMVHSLKYDYYKFPGGGIEENETHLDALIRETLEESGLAVIPSTVREYGCVRRVQRCEFEGYDIFVQDNFYYLCQAETDVREQDLDGYEADERFTLEFVDPHVAISVNRERDHGPKDQNMIEREARVLSMLLSENLI